MSYIILLSVLLVQRLFEISKGNRHLNKNIESLVSPLDQSEKKQMMLLHTLWFISCAVEFGTVGGTVPPLYFIMGVAGLIWCQYVRFRSMQVLGEAWVQYPVAFKNQKIVSDGPYQFIKHPNYLIVLIEVALVPLLGKCFWTAAVFSFFNFFFLNAG